MNQSIGNRGRIVLIYLTINKMITITKEIVPIQISAVDIGNCNPVDV